MVKKLLAKGERGKLGPKMRGNYLKLRTCPKRWKTFWKQSVNWYNYGIHCLKEPLNKCLYLLDSIQKYLDSALSENEEAEEKDKEEDKAKNISKDEKKGEDTG